MTKFLIDKQTLVEQDGEPMDGVLPVDKPAGLTSHRVVSQARKLLNIEKIGHTGTLDPYATGVLVLCLGKATRISEFLVRSVKGYRTVMKLGVTTDTQDLTGRILSEKPVVVSEEELREQVQKFIGEIYQVPPMFSALKVQGRRLYKLARQGKEVVRAPRKVTVYDLHILEVNFPFVSFQITCSHGTYIRTLVSDLGERLGCGACVWELRRTHVGPFGLDEVVDFERLESLSPAQVAEKYLVPMDKALVTLPAVYLDEKVSRLLSQGTTVTLAHPNLSPGSSVPQLLNPGERDEALKGYFRGYDAAGNFFAIVRLTPAPTGASERVPLWKVQPAKVIYPA